MELLYTMGKERPAAGSINDQRATISLRKRFQARIISDWLYCHGRAGRNSALIRCRVKFNFICICFWLLLNIAPHILTVFM